MIQNESKASLAQAMDQWRRKAMLMEKENNELKEELRKIRESDAYEAGFREASDACTQVVKNYQMEIERLERDTGNLGEALTILRGSSQKDT